MQAALPLRTFARVPRSGSRSNACCCIGIESSSNRKRSIAWCMAAMPPGARRHPHDLAPAVGLPCRPVGTRRRLRTAAGRPGVNGGRLLIDEVFIRVDRLPRRLRPGLRHTLAGQVCPGAGRRLLRRLNGSEMGQTFGKRPLSIQVRDAPDGRSARSGPPCARRRRALPARPILRALHVVQRPAAAGDRRRKALHDKIAGSVVVQLPSRDVRATGTERVKISIIGQWLVDRGHELLVPILRFRALERHRATDSRWRQDPAPGSRRRRRCRSPPPAHRHGVEPEAEFGGPVAVGDGLAGPEGGQGHLDGVGRGARPPTDTGSSTPNSKAPASSSTLVPSPMWASLRSFTIARRGRTGPAARRVDRITDRPVTPAVMFLLESQTRNARQARCAVSRPPAGDLVLSRWRWRRCRPPRR